MSMVTSTPEEEPEEEEEDEDEEDLDGHVTKKLRGETKTKSKLAHSTAEKRRRDAIKDAYTNLTESLLPMREEEKQKLTRADILDMACTRAEALKSAIAHKQAECETLQRKLNALNVIADAYDSMPKTSEKTSIPPDLNCVVSNHIKLKLFTTLISKQFESFSVVITTDNLQTLASSLFYWVEVHWRPVDLKEYLIGLLKVLRNRFVDKTIGEAPGSSSRAY